MDVLLPFLQIAYLREILKSLQEVFSSLYDYSYSFSIRPSTSVFPVKQETLLEEGWEIPQGAGYIL